MFLLSAVIIFPFSFLLICLIFRKKIRLQFHHKCYRLFWRVKLFFFYLKPYLLSSCLKTLSLKEVILQASGKILQDNHL